MSNRPHRNFAEICLHKQITLQEVHSELDIILPGPYEYYSNEKIMEEISTLTIKYDFSENMPVCFPKSKSELSRYIICCEYQFNYIDWEQRYLEELVSYDNLVNDYSDETYEIFRQMSLEDVFTELEMLHNDEHCDGHCDCPMCVKEEIEYNREQDKLRKDYTLDTSPKIDVNSVVYFIIASHYIKIGKTVNLRSRINVLQVGCPIVYEKIYYMYGAHPLERQLHRQFKAQRVSGEWFISSPSLIQFIIENCAVYDYSNDNIQDSIDLLDKTDMSSEN